MTGTRISFSDVMSVEGKFEVNILGFNFLGKHKYDKNQCFAVALRRIIWPDCFS